MKRAESLARLGRPCVHSGFAHLCLPGDGAVGVAFAGDTDFTASNGTAALILIL